MRGEGENNKERAAEVKAVVAVAAATKGVVVMMVAMVVERRTQEGKERTKKQRHVKPMTDERVNRNKSGK